MKKNIAKSSFKSHLAAYSATAAALCTAPNTHATIQNISSATYTLMNQTGGEFSGVLRFGPFNINNFVGGIFVGSGGGGVSNGTDFIAGNIFRNGGSASNLALGGAIVGGPFNNGYALLASKLAFTGATVQLNGKFLPGANAAETGYVGLKTVNNGHTYYGWLRIKVTADGNDFPASVSVLSENGVVGAYGLPSDNITAGELAPTPEPSTLAIGGLSLLALGARGVRELRRRRENAAKN